MKTSGTSMQGGSELAVRVEKVARVLRRHVVEMVGKAGSGHPGGSLSAADIMAALYFGDVLKVDPKNPRWPDRDRFVLSKGHAAPVLYAALAERSFFSIDLLPTLRQLGSILQGHQTQRRFGVEVSTGLWVRSVARRRDAGREARQEGLPGLGSAGRWRD